MYFILYEGFLSKNLMSYATKTVSIHKKLSGQSTTNF